MSEIFAKLHDCIFTIPVNTGQELFHRLGSSISRQSGENRKMANRIKELREARKLTLEQLADAAGTSFQQVQRLESGARRLTEDWMRRLAPALKVPPAALMTDEAPNQGEFVQSLDEVFLLRFWRTLGVPEKRMIAAMALDRGVEILIDQAKRRRA